MGTPERAVRGSKTPARRRRDELIPPGPEPDGQRLAALTAPRFGVHP
jgi:hypothetical protein